MAHAIMRGCSMLPLLREGMILEVECRTAPRRAGEIAVFRAGDRVVAHRLLRTVGQRLICCGDAQPDRLDVVPLCDLIGTLRAVYVTQNGALRRVDGLAFWVRGYANAHLHPLRSFVHRLAPHRRERVYRALTAVAGAVMQNNPEQLLQTIESITPWRLAEVAKKHRVGALLCEALETQQTNEYARAVYKGLQRIRWSVAAFAPRYRAQVVSVIQCLQDAGIEFVLLKGAARAFRREAGWTLHQSSDIDVLVAPADVQRTCDALVAKGYAGRSDAASESFYRKHHHAAPLFPPNGGVCVEVHRALRRDLQDRTTLEQLRSHVLCIREDGLSANVFDTAATAAHIALHGAPRAMLRDVLLLGRLLTNMSQSGRDGVRRMVEELSNADVRARALLALAAQLAGLSWKTDRQTQRFVRWMIQREDLPRPLRARPESMDACFAARRSRVEAVLRSVFEAASPKTAAARAGAAAMTVLYLAFMR